LSRQGFAGTAVTGRASAYAKPPLLCYVPVGVENPGGMVGEAARKPPLLDVPAANKVCVPFFMEAQV